MEINNDHIIEMWELLSESVVPTKRNDTAYKFVEYLLNNEYDKKELVELRGQDEHLDYAFDQLDSDDEELAEDDDYIEFDE